MIGPVVVGGTYKYIRQQESQVSWLTTVACETEDWEHSERTGDGVDSIHGSEIIPLHQAYSDRLVCHALRYLPLYRQFELRILLTHYDSIASCWRGDIERSVECFGLAVSPSGTQGQRKEDKRSSSDYACHI